MSTDALALQEAVVSFDMMLIMYHWSEVLHWFCIAMVSLKNIERHTARTIVSWPNPKQWVILHTSDLMMIIRHRIYILSIITRDMGKLKTHGPTYCIMDNWEYMLYLIHTLDKTYLTGILEVQCLQINLHNDDNEMVQCTNKRKRSSSQNVSDYLHSIINCTIIMKTNPGFPGMYM